MRITVEHNRDGVPYLIVVPENPIECQALRDVFKPAEGQIRDIVARVEGELQVYDDYGNHALSLWDKER